MDERWMVDDARDELILTATMMQRLHDKLRFGLLQPDQVAAATGGMLVRLKQSLALVEQASSSLHRAPRIEPVEPRAVDGSRPVAEARPFAAQEKTAATARSALEAEIARQEAAMGVSARSGSGSFTRC